MSDEEFLKIIEDIAARSREKEEKKKELERKKKEEEMVRQSKLDLSNITF